MGTPIVDSRFTITIFCEENGVGKPVDALITEQQLEWFIQIENDPECGRLATITGRLGPVTIDSSPLKVYDESMVADEAINLDSFEKLYPASYRDILTTTIAYMKSDVVEDFNKLLLAAATIIDLGKSH